MVVVIYILKVVNTVQSHYMVFKLTVVVLGYDWWLCMVINVYSMAVGFSPTLYC